MELTLEQLELVAFWAKVKSNELGLSPAEEQLLSDIQETLNFF